MVLNGSQSTPLKLAATGVSSTPTCLSATAWIFWAKPVPPEPGDRLVLAFPVALAASAAFAAVRAEGGSAASARCAAARCVAAGAVQACGRARCHAVARAPGRPLAQLYRPVCTSRQIPRDCVKTPVAAPSWKLAAAFCPRDLAGLKLAMAHWWPAAEPTCRVPARTPPTSAAG